MMPPPGGRDGDSKPQKDGNSESDIVNVAIKQLPVKIRERLEKLFDEGLLKDNDLDLRSITVFASLNEGLQDRVMTHMENERIYVANARSKSGFMIATCDKAKTGCLDARGLGAIDPWRSALVAMATPKQKLFDLKPERDWLDEHDGPIKLNINVAQFSKEAGSDKLELELPLSETSAALKSELVKLGITSIPTNKMKLFVEPVGFLKDRLPLAYYNLVDGVEVVLGTCKRGGQRYRKDHAVPLKRPKRQDKADQASNPSDFLKLQQGGGALPDLKAPAGLQDFSATLAAMKAGGALPGGGLPGLPGLPSLPSLPSAGGALGGMPGGTAPGGLPGLAGLLSSGPKMGGLPGLPGLSLPGGGCGGLPGLPGLPGLGGGLGGLSLPGGGGLAGLTMPGGGLGGLGGLGGMTMPSKASGPVLTGGLLSGSMLAGGMAKLGGLMPGGLSAGLGGMSTMPKLGGGLPGLPGLGDLPAMPKLGSFPGLGGDASMGKSMPMGSTAKGGGAPPPGF